MVIWEQPERLVAGILKFAQLRLPPLRRDLRADAAGMLSVTAKRLQPRYPYSGICMYAQMPLYG